MTTPIEERISAFSDDELGSFETRRLSRELLADEEKRARWARYQLIGDALRDDLPENLNLDFSRQIMAEIAHEPTFTRSSRVAGGRWMKPAVGVAIAASVALVSIFTLKSLTGDTAPVAELADSGAASTPAPGLVPDAVAAAPGASELHGAVIQPVSADLAEISGREIQPLGTELIDPRINSYMATHAEYAVQPGLMPQVRVVGAEKPGSE